MVVADQRHGPAALPLGKTWNPLYTALGGPQGRSGLVLKISPPTGFNPRNVQPLASHYTACTVLSLILLRVAVNSLSPNHL
jgi:hypothetical protein